MATSERDRRRFEIAAHVLVAVVAPFFVLLLLANPADAKAKLVFSLHYESPAATCPDADTVQAAAAREVGYEVFQPTAKSQASLVIALAEDQLTARVAFFDASGLEQAVRALSAGKNRCRDLVRAFALLVALHVQASEQLAPAPPPPLAKPTPRPSPAAPASPTPPPAAAPPPADDPQPSKPVVRDVAAEAAQPTLLPPKPASSTAALWAGPIVRTGIAPGLKLGLRLGASWSWRPSLRVNADVDGVAKAATPVPGGGAIDVTAAFMSLSTCWSPIATTAASVWLCPYVANGLVHVAGKGLDVPRTDQTWSLTGGLEGRIAFLISGPWLVEFAASAAYNPRPHQILADDVNIWTSQRFWVTGGVVGGYRWGDP